MYLLSRYFSNNFLGRGAIPLPFAVPAPGNSMQKRKLSTGPSFLFVMPCVILRCFCAASFFSPGVCTARGESLLQRQARSAGACRLPSWECCRWAPREPTVWKPRALPGWREWSSPAQTDWMGWKPAVQRNPPNSPDQRDRRTDQAENRDWRLRPAYPRRLLSSPTPEHRGRNRRAEL